VGVEGDSAPLIIVHTLDDFTGVRVDDESRATEVVGEDAVDDAALAQVGRDVRFAGVDEARDEVVPGIELGDGAKLVTPDPTSARANAGPGAAGGACRSQAAGVVCPV
jgi:hypothetical protein